MVLYALYTVANYAHSRDTKFGQSTVARIFVIAGIIIYLSSILLVPIDAELKTRGELALKVDRYIWIAVVFSQLSFIWVIYPLLFALYETDDTDKWLRRLWDALRLQLPLWITLLVLCVPTFWLANEVKIPADVASFV